MEFRRVLFRSDDETFVSITLPSKSVALAHTLEWSNWKLPLATTKPMAGLAAKLDDRAPSHNRRSEARRANLNIRTISFRMRCSHRPNNLQNNLPRPAACSSIRVGRYP